MPFFSWDHLTGSILPVPLLSFHCRQIDKLWPSKNRNFKHYLETPTTFKRVLFLKASFQLCQSPLTSKALARHKYTENFDGLPIQRFWPLYNPIVQQNMKADDLALSGKSWAERFIAIMRAASYPRQSEQQSPQNPSDGGFNTTRVWWSLKNDK